MKFDWAIWKSTGDSNDVRFVHESELPAAGFASVYRYTETDAKAMQALGSFKGFKGTVYSERLQIDADTAEASEACEGRLKAQGIAFEKFTTGNRGHHYHVVRSTPPSHVLPGSDKFFVKSEYPGCDVSFYHHVGLYRQIGARHAKTGNRKELLYSVPGKVLELPLVVPAELEVELPKTTSTILEHASVFEDDMLYRMTVPADHGERHKRYIDIAIRLDVLNQPFDFAVGWLYNVDLMSGGGMPHKDLVRIVEWAYYQRAK